MIFPLTLHVHFWEKLSRGQLCLGPGKYLQQRPETDFSGEKSAKAKLKGKLS
jgi:hypothetical protein